MTEPRPAFYALAPGGWRDYVTLLHPPYTLWHLSYVATGAALAPVLHVDRLAAGLLAFFLALGIGAHALDELHGRPLRTQIPGRMLVALAAVSIAAAVTIGVAAALTWQLELLPLVVFGGFVVVAYNLELFGGRFHGDLWFALAWGALPLVAGYVVMAGRPRASAIAGAAFAFALSLAQRRLSTHVRAARRQARTLEGTEAAEAALRLLAWAAAALAAGLVLTHLYD